MIIVDLSQIEHATAFWQHKSTGHDDRKSLHKGVLQSIASIRDTLKDKYGTEVIACCDHHHTWRKDVFPAYKCTRATRRAESGIDWPYVRQAFREVETAMDDCTNVTIVRVDGAEGDDCVSVVADRNQFDADSSLGGLAVGGYEPTVIVSSDKDYGQVHNVDHWCPRKKIFLHYDPRIALAELVVGGDTADAVPNVISADDCFSGGTRQAVMTAKRRAMLLDMYLAGDTADAPADPTSKMPAAHWQRNIQLIDFRHIPAAVQSDIINTLEDRRARDRQGAFQYLVEHHMMHIVEEVKRLT